MSKTRSTGDERYRCMDLAECRPETRTCHGVCHSQRSSDSAKNLRPFRYEREAATRSSRRLSVAGCSWKGHLEPTVVSASQLIPFQPSEVRVFSLLWSGVKTSPSAFSSILRRVSLDAKKSWWHSPRTYRSLIILPVQYMSIWPTDNQQTQPQHLWLDMLDWQLAISV